MSQKQIRFCVTTGEAYWFQWRRILDIVGRSKTASHKAKACRNHDSRTFPERDSFSDPSCIWKENRPDRNNVRNPTRRRTPYDSPANR